MENIVARRNENFGIQETIDIFNAVKAVKEGVKLAKLNDGAVTNNEYLGIVFSAAQPVLKAAEGIEDVPKEIADLSDEEQLELREKGYGEFLDNPLWVKAVFHAIALADTIYEIVIEDQANNKVLA